MQYVTNENLLLTLTFQILVFVKKKKDVRSKQNKTIFDSKKTKKFFVKRIAFIKIAKSWQRSFKVCFLLQLKYYCAVGLIRSFYPINSY
jgi:hypothetical protein